MAGIIKTYQKCRKCGGRFPSSKGDTLIECPACKTQPTKFFIKIKYKQKDLSFYYDKDGKTIHHFQHALAVLGEIRSSIARTKSGKGFFDPEAYKKQSKTSFQTFWIKFIDKYKDRPATYDKILAVGRHHLTYFYDFQMRDILTWHIDEWWESLKAKGLSVHYRNDCLQWLKRFFKAALRLDIIEKLPNFPETAEMQEPDVDDWLSMEEQLRVLEKIPRHDRPIYDFLFLTGVRVNEATGLQRKDIKWDKNLTIIQHTIKRDGSLGVVKNKKKRIIPHVPEIANCLKEAIKISGLNNYAFINKWGRRYTDDYLRSTFNKACLDAEVKPIKLKNATRHSFGMGLLRKGYDIWQASKAMNHSGIRMTEHYVKMLASEMEKMYGRDAEADKKRTNGKKEVISN